MSTRSRSAALVFAILLVPVWAGARAGAAKQVCTIKGTDHDDVLTGRPGDDVICGLGGDDVLRGADGDDVLRGGPGKDTVSYEYATSGVTVSLRQGRATGLGTDTVDRIEIVIGSPQDDVIEGSPEADDLTGLDGDDRITGLGGGDRITGSGGADRLEGNLGDDSVSGDWGDDTVDGGYGRDLLFGGPGVDRLLGGKGTDGCVQWTEHGVKRGCERRAYAGAEGLLLFVPSSEPVGFGYHESLFGSAMALRPLGQVDRNANVGKFSPPPPTDGPDYVVMDTRGRTTPATSATDIVLPSRSEVLAPIDATVVAVERYLLYCEIPDWKVVLRPDDRPDLRVLVLHMAEVHVRAGQHVSALLTELGITHENDEGGAQENRYFPDQYPHIHIEVERDGASPTPGCDYP